MCCYSFLLKETFKVKAEAEHWFSLEFFKELKDHLRIKGYLHSGEKVKKSFFAFFRGEDEKYSTRKLRYFELL